MELLMGVERGGACLDLTDGSSLPGLPDVGLVDSESAEVRGWRQKKPHNIGFSAVGAGLVACRQSPASRHQDVGQTAQGTAPHEEGIHRGSCGARWRAWGSKSSGVTAAVLGVHVRRRAGPLGLPGRPGGSKSIAGRRRERCGEWMKDEAEVGPHEMTAFLRLKLVAGEGSARVEESSMGLMSGDVLMHELMYLKLFWDI
ncbi:hypothetical protein FB451DRAFT_1204898 [Mycena latifolia]|nr:hypothetical protein FB451DRAFT_1204898 [Mycena latifolia]